jgi:hypothetical protein
MFTLTIRCSASTRAARRWTDLRRDFRGALCAYCGTATATSEDHVFAKKFFLERDRDSLPKAPACDGCNNRKSALEGYLTVALPFAGRHAQAVENLTTAVPKRLAGNRRVSRQISSPVRWLGEPGDIISSIRLASSGPP